MFSNGKPEELVLGLRSLVLYIVRPVKRDTGGYSHNQLNQMEIGLVKSYMSIKFDSRK